MTLVRLREPADAAVEEPEPLEDLDPSQQPEISIPPEVPDLPEGARFIDVVYRSPIGKLPLRFALDEADLPHRMSAIAYQVYALEGTAGLEHLNAAFLRIGREPIILSGPAYQQAEADRRVLLAALRRCKEEIEKRAARACRWAEDVSRTFAIRRLICNREQTARERERVFRPTSGDTPLGRRDLSGPALLALAKAWQPIVVAMAALDDAKEDLSGLISDAMVDAYVATPNSPLGHVEALARAYMATMHDPRVALASDQKQQREQALLEAVACAGSQFPLMFRIWSNGQLARSMVKAVHSAGNDSERIVAIRKIPDLKETIVDAFEHATRSANEAIEIFENADNDIVWRFPPLLEKVRIAAGIRPGTLEWNAIEERSAKAGEHWISKVSAAASLIGRIPSPVMLLANAVAFVLGVVEIAMAVVEISRGNTIVDAALDPSESIAAEQSLMGMFGILAVQLVVFKMLGRLGGYIGVGLDVASLFP